jgi:hypothetical protein
MDNARYRATLKAGMPDFTIRNDAIFDRHSLAYLGFFLCRMSLIFTTLNNHPLKLAGLNCGLKVWIRAC